MTIIIVGVLTLVLTAGDIFRNINRSVDNYDRDRQCQTSDVAYYADAKDLSECKAVQKP